MMAVLIGTFRKIVEHKDLDSKLKDYCAALIQQFKSEESKERFRKEYRKLYNEHQISELEEEADSEARITSRIITTVESRAHRENMQKRLDQWFNEDERNTDDESDTEEGLQETEEDIQLFTYMDDPFREEEEQVCARILHFERGEGEERSIFCEVYVPIFKAFGNCLKVLNYTWCEKKAKDSDYVWLVSNDFSKEKRDNLKLLDGVGTLVNTKSTYLLMESSGYSNNKLVSHSLNDTLKNIKNAHDCLKYLFSQYRSASFETIKKVNIFSCQIIENKITLIKYAVKSRSTWKVIECRSASVPLKIHDSLEYIKVFELFAFMLADIQEQQVVFKQLKMENLGLVPVRDEETVSHCLL